MKKFLTSMLVLIILTSVSPLPANATIISGLKCSRSGMKQVYKGKTYTCIKLGKKLYWNNGVKNALTSTVPVVVPTQTPLPIVGTVSQQNAVNRARGYLETSSFSRTRLIKQLEFEGFSNADATYGVDIQNIDWRNQAVLRAKGYLQTTSFSRTSLIKQLVFEGFSDSDSLFGVDAQNANWSEQAALRAQSYLRISAFSRDRLVSQLLFEGFTSEQALYGVGTTGL